ncbi:MAG: MarR family winged helix-turn-helix transcriptional regulator [Phenylobacterium sp.]
MTQADKTKLAATRRKPRASSHPDAAEHLPSISEAAVRFYQSHHFFAPDSRADLNFRFTGRLNLIARRYRTRLNEQLKAIGQTQARWEALFWISLSGEHVTQSELAERMGVEGPTLVRMLNKLEQEGLVERRSAKGDRRAKTLRLKGAAEQALADIARLSSPFRDDLLDGIPEEDLKVCLSVFDAMMARLERD